MAVTLTKRSNAVRDVDTVNAVFGASGEVDSTGVWVKLPLSAREVSIQNTGESALLFGFGGNVAELEASGPTCPLAADSTISLRMNNPVLFMKTADGESTSYAVYTTYFSSSEIYDFVEGE